MKLTAKFLLGFVAASLAALGVFAFFRVRRETEYFDAHMRSHAEAYAASLAHGIATVERADPQQALALVTKANASSPQFRARWVALAASAGPLAAPRVPRAQLEPVQRGERLSLELPGEAGAAGVLVTYVSVDAALPASARSAVEVVESLREERDFVRETIRSTLLFSLSVLGLTSGVAAAMGVIMIARPVRTLVAKAQRISTGDLSGPVVLRQRDELGLLAAEMNAMCERLEAARVRLDAATAARIAALEQMRHADRLVTVGRLASGLAHEIGTPLAVASGRAGMIASGEVHGAEAVENARIAGEQMRRISAIIRQLLDFARRRPARQERVDLHMLASHTGTLLQPLAAKRGLRLEIHTDSAPCGDALGDLGQLEQALTNVVMNAFHATPRGGRVDIHCSRGCARPTAEPGAAARDVLSLAVTDTGSGMTRDVQAHIFEPFFTTKPVGEGSGLGLAVTYGIVQEHGGWMDVESEPGHGSRITIHLPVLAASA